ncbi:MAG TPA: HEAT repeat domain-containing protein [Phototrophicaceae bacterium]|nr:HEAT repeat domain-containing protein [Phototrophicaceae bacterium]
MKEKAARKIRVGDYKTIWLGGDAYSDRIANAESILERILPAQPSTHFHTVRAVFRSTRGHEADNLIGGEFVPNTSDKLIVRVPITQRTYEHYDLKDQLAAKIMAHIVIAHYVHLAGVSRLGAGILSLDKTGIHPMLPNGWYRIHLEVLQLLPLLWCDTFELSDEDVIYRLNAGGSTNFGETDNHVIPGLLNALSDQDLNVRREVVRLMGKIKSAAVVPSLISLLETDPELSEEIGAALADIKKSQEIVPQQSDAVLDTVTNPETIDRLLTSLNTEPDDARILIIRELGKLHAQTTGTKLIEILSNEAETTKIRQEAANALGKLRFTEAVPQLIGLLNHHNTGIVAKAIAALGEIGDKRAVPALIEKLEDKRPAYYLDWYVYTWAEEALRNFETPEVVEAVNNAFRKRNRLKK